jgi:hypothetical protein
VVQFPGLRGSLHRALSPVTGRDPGSVAAAADGSPPYVLGSMIGAACARGPGIEFQPSFEGF